MIDTLSLNSIESLLNLEVLRGQQIKLIHAVSNEDFHDYYDHDQRNQTQLHKVNDLISVLYHNASTSQTLETSPQGLISSTHRINLFVRKHLT